MSKTPSPNSSLPAVLADYFALLEEIKRRVHRGQVRAALAANGELIVLYWDIGHLILSRQAREGWGAKVIDRLSVDLQRAFPGRQGFSPRNLKYMRAFAVAWPEAVFVQRPGAQIEPGSVVQGALAQLPWYHHIALLDKLDGAADRLGYAAKAVKHGWSRDILELKGVTDRILTMIGGLTK